MNMEKKREIINEVKNIQNDLITSIRELVSIYSVETDSSENMPFGEGPYKALCKALEISEKLGFQTKNIDNKIGYAQYGEGKDGYIEIFGHVDAPPWRRGSRRRTRSGGCRTPSWPWSS